MNYPAYLHYPVYPLDKLTIENLQIIISFGNRVSSISCLNLWLEEITTME